MHQIPRFEFNQFKSLFDDFAMFEEYLNKIHVWVLYTLINLIFCSRNTMPT